MTKWINLSNNFNCRTFTKFITCKNWTIMCCCFIMHTPTPKICHFNINKSMIWIFNTCFDHWIKNILNTSLMTKVFMSYNSIQFTFNRLFSSFCYITSIKILINCLKPTNIVMWMRYYMNIHFIRFTQITCLYSSN